MDARQTIQNEVGDEELLFADGFDAALLGWGGAFNQMAAVYDYDVCIDVLVFRDGMTQEDAVEYFEFNVIGAYVGEHTPIFLKRSPAEGHRYPEKKK